MDWISVKERLPEVWADIIFFTSSSRLVWEGQLTDEEVWRSVATDGYNDPVVSVPHDYEDVTHWMPMPKPPVLSPTASLERQE